MIILDIRFGGEEKWACGAGAWRSLSGVIAVTGTEAGAAAARGMIAAMWFCYDVITVI